MEEDMPAEVTKIARDAAAVVAPSMTQRLVAVYGADWLTKVNDRRGAEGRGRGKSLSDERFCLALLGHDPATDGWVAEARRRMARELGSLATRAAHNEVLTSADLSRARSIYQSLRDLFEPLTTRASGDRRPKSPTRAPDDVETIIIVSARQARERSVIPVKLTVGTGRPPKSRTVNVRLPPNLSSGQTIRAKGKGVQRADNIQPGDLYITVLIDNLA